MNSKLKYFNSQLGATVYPSLRQIFFYGGIFSQWADGEFLCKALDMRVNCAEQAMMLMKAKTMGDERSFNLIRASQNPSEQKMLGRMIADYDEDKWAAVRFNIVKNISYDKFVQHPKWRDLLLLTEGCEIIEASPTDFIWGIGMAENSPNLLQRELWGDNLLGKAIMFARDLIFLEKLS